MSELISRYWYVLVGGIGILLILGAVFKWKWAMQKEGDRPLGFMSWIYTLFGESVLLAATGRAKVPKRRAGKTKSGNFAGGKR